jgi:hypothetical protein
LIQTITPDIGLVSLFCGCFTPMENATAVANFSKLVEYQEQFLPQNAC